MLKWPVATFQGKGMLLRDQLAFLSEHEHGRHGCHPSLVTGRRATPQGSWVKCMDETPRICLQNIVSWLPPGKGRWPRVKEAGEESVRPGTVNLTPPTAAADGLGRTGRQAWR